MATTYVFRVVTTDAAALDALDVALRAALPQASILRSVGLGAGLPAAYSLELYVTDQVGASLATAGAIVQTWERRYGGL